MAKVPHLIDQVSPHYYNLKLNANFDDWTFTLKERIKFELKEPSNSLVFHAVGLNVRSATCDDVAVKNIALSPDDQTVTFSLADTVAAGQHVLDLDVSGTIQDSLHGFYYSGYRQPDGTQAWMAMTQFEAIHAREALVCIDEPAAKAIFELEITGPAGLTFLSNAPARTTSAQAGRQTVVFEPTPKMSTYLLAWVMSELAHTGTKTSSGVDINVFATPVHGEHLEYAADFARRSLEWYEDYFALPYPLPKLDLVAVPNFAAGAMENWGLVTYRETDLVVDEANTSLANRQRVAEVIAHELAHQWFGNLVTMNWWQDLWLNESFASWAETMTVDHLEPDWQWWASFTAGLGAHAREIDALANTHPILVEVDDPRGLDEIFDAISYFKGQAILRMLEGYLGSEVFRDGLRIYLKRHAYGNSQTADLWRALGEASGKDVAGLMTAWTTIPGYPILSFADGQLTQERYVASRAESQRLAQAGQAPVWPVPVSFRSPEGKTSESVVADQPSQPIPSDATDAAWFKPNPAEQGFYRVSYSDDILEALLPHLTELDLADRYGLVNDVWAGAASGRSGTRKALELTASLRQESDYIPALAVYESLGMLFGIVEDDGLRARLEAFGRWLAEPGYQRLGWDATSTENHFDTLLRPVVLQQALRFDVPGAAKEALARFATMAQGEDVDPNIRSAILYGAARHGKEQQFDQLLDLYRSEEAPHNRQAQLLNLGRFRQPELGRRALEFAMGPEVKLQDVVYGLSGPCRTREHRALAWQFLQDQWDELIRRFGDGGHMLDRFPDMAAGTYATLEHAEAVEQFFAAHPHPAITRPAAQAVEGIRHRADWFARSKPDIEAFLDAWEAQQAA